MIGVALVSETRLDLGAFMDASRSVTGINHVQVADLRPGLCQLVDDINILRDFARKDVDLSGAVTHIGFLVAGMIDNLREIIEYTRGMTHLSTSLSLRQEIGCVLISGSLEDWTHAIIEGSGSHQYPTTRQAFNQMYTIMCQKGLGFLFEGWETRDSHDGTFLLLEHK